MSKLIDEPVVEQVSLLAPNYYSARLPYHNFEHVLATLEHFENICDRLLERDVYINRNIGRVAIYMHDAGFDIDHIAEGFDTKEEHSAHLSSIVLQNLGVQDTEIERVNKAIIDGTTVTKQPKNNLEKAVRYADLGNVYGRSYVDFVKNFMLLQKESVVMRKPLAESFEDQRELSLGFLTKYLVPMTFKTDSGDVIELPEDLNYAERNMVNLSKSTVKGLAKLPGVPRLMPRQWLDEAAKLKNRLISFLKTYNLIELFRESSK